MVNDIFDFIGRQSDIDADQGCAEHGHCIMGFQHGRNIGTDESHLVTFADTVFFQAVGKPEHPLLQLGIGILF